MVAPTFGDFGDGEEKIGAVLSMGIKSGPDY